MKQIRFCTCLKVRGRVEVPAAATSSKIVHKIRSKFTVLTMIITMEAVGSLTSKLKACNLNYKALMHNCDNNTYQKQ